MFQAVVLGFDGVLRPAPGGTVPEVRDWLAPLRGQCRLALLVAGDPAPVRRQLDLWGVGTWFDRVLGTAQLGGLANPPRPLAFRWLQKRLDVPPHACLYVAGSAALARAARRAGWHALELPSALDPAVDWDQVLAADGA